MIRRLELTIKTKLGLLVTTLINTVLFFALVTTAQSNLILEASSSLITEDLELYLNAAIQESYPGTGSNWNDISGKNRAPATLLSGLPFDNNNKMFVKTSVSDIVDTNFQTTKTNDFTVEINYQRTTSTFWAPLWASEHWNDGTGYLLYFSSSNVLNFSRGGGSGGLTYVFPSSGSPSSSAMNTYSVTVTSAGFATILINGVAVQSGNITLASSIPNTFKISTRHENNGVGASTGDSKNANFSMFRFYSTALTNAEILQNFNSDGQVPLVSSLEYNAGEFTSYSGTGTAVSDLSGNNNHGTLQNGVVYSSDFGGYFDFRTTNSEITTTTQIASPGPQEFSIESWVRVPENGVGKIIGYETNQTGPSSGSYDRHLYVGSDGTLIFGVYPGALHTLTSTETSRTNQWIHVVATYSNSANTMRLFVNGVQQASRTDTTYAQEYAGYWRIGGYKLNSWLNGSDGYFNGDISEIRLYNSPINASAVQELYENSKSRFESKTIAFDANAGTGSIASITSMFSGIVTLPSTGFNRDGFAFSGFNTQADGNGVSYALGSSFQVPIEATSTLYAKWSPTLDRYDSGIIRIDKTKVQDNLTNFPVTIVLNSGNFNFDLIQTSGADVFFTDSNNNLLPFEVDYLNVAEQRAVYHVLYSGVITSGLEDQDILIRYGQVDGHFYDFTQGYQSSGVWKNGYVLVMHMGDQLFDSVGSGVTGIINSGTTVIPSSIGQARDFSATDFGIEILSDYLRLNTGGSNTNRSFVVMFSGVDHGTQQQLISYRGENLNASNDVTLQPGGKVQFGMYHGGSSAQYLVKSSGNINFNTTNGYLISTNGGTSTDNRMGTFDGVLNGDNRFDPGSYPELYNNNIASRITIGFHLQTLNTASNYRSFRGSIDEVRISDVLRSPAWLSAEYDSLLGELANPIYTVSFETNSGTSVASITGEAGSGISPVTTRSGYVFEGWFTNSALTTPAADPLVIPVGDSTLYAKWRLYRVIAMARPTINNDNRDGFVLAGSINSFTSSGFTDSGVYLTTSTGQASSVFLDKQFSASADGGFSSYFVLDVRELNSELPADGFVFVIAANKNSLGGAGGGFGYAGISDSIGLEFDFYDNGDEPPIHIDLHQDGVIENAGFTIIDSTTGWTSTDDRLFRRYHVWLDYDQATSGLSVYIISGLTASTNLPRPSVPTQTYTIDMNSVVGPTYFVGFTAGTGGAAAKFVVPTFYFSTTRFEEGIDVTFATYAEDTLVLTTPTLISSQNNNQPVLTIAVPESSDPGFDRLEYQVDGGAWTTYTQALVLTSGMTTITARGVSLSGRTSSIGSYTLSKIVYNVDNAIDEVVIITSGQGPITLKTTTTSGARIANWYGNSGYTGTAITNASYDSVTTVYGESIFEYTVVLSPGHSQATSSTTVTYGQALPSGLTPPTQTGYIFQGYFENTNGQGTQYYSSGMVSLTNWTTYSGATLYADWDAATYVVNFENSGVFSSSGTVVFDSTYALPTVTRTGYTFNGWFTASTGGTEITSSSTVSTASNHTLYARWTPLTFTVTFSDPIGGTPSPTTITVTYDSTYGALAEVTRTGYTFAGWFDSATPITSNDVVSITADQTLSATWQANQYTVNFNKQSGTGGTDSGLVTFDAAMPSGLSAPTREGYAFDGYYSSISGGGTKYYDSGMVTVQNWNVAIDTSLYANWIANSYTVTFDSSGISVSAETITVVFASTYGTLPTATRTGYTFNGWFTAATGGTEIGGATSVSIADDQTLFAQWTAVFYDVVFDSNFETGTTFIQSIDFDATASLSMNTFIRTGYTFTGWNTQADGQGTPYNDGVSFTMTTVGITLYAQWSVNNYTITFNQQSGVDGTASGLVTFDAAMTSGFTAPSRTGYTFDGYFTDVDGSGVQYYSSGMSSLRNWDIAQPTTLYASWIANTYSIVFNANQGTGSMSNQTIAFAQTATLTDNEYTRTGYTFSGWNTQANGSGISYANQSAFTMNVTGITLYAQWTGNPYVVTFNQQSGVNGTVSGLVTFGSPMPSGFTPPTRTGYTFDGYFTTSNQLTAHSITYEMNWGTNAISNPATFTIEDTIVFASGTKSGYEFAGFYTNAAYTGSVITGIAAGTNAPLTLYAKWTPIDLPGRFQLNWEVFSSVPTNTWGGKIYALSGVDFDIGFSNISPVASGSGIIASYPNAETYSGRGLLKWLSVGDLRTAIGGGNLPSADMFAVRLTGYFVPSQSGVYTFSVTGDDATDLTLIGPGIAGQWTIGRYGGNGTGTLGAAQGTGSISLEAGVVYEIRIRQQEHGGGEGLKVGWRHPGQTTNYSVYADELYASSPINISYNENDATDANGSGGQYYSSGMISLRNWDIAQPTTLYAQWTGNPYDLVFDANLGNGSMTNQTIVFDQTATLTDNQYTRTGYTFSGWNTQADGNGTAYANGADFTMDALGDTLFAQWSEDSYSITYVLNNGTLTNAINGYSFTSGTITLPTTISREFFDFNGWFTSSNFTGSAVSTFDSTDDEDKTFYAKFTPVEFNITYDYDVNPNTPNHPSLYRELTIPHGKIDADLTNFPLTVVLDETNFDFTGITYSGIYFTDANNTLLDFEVDSVATSPNKVVYHVRIPFVSSSQDTIVKVYYSNEVDYSNGNNSSDVWDANYIFVSHMGPGITNVASSTPVTQINTITFGSGLLGDVANFNGGFIELPSSLNTNAFTKIILATPSQTNAVHNLMTSANDGVFWIYQGDLRATYSNGFNPITRLASPTIQNNQVGFFANRFSNDDSFIWYNQSSTSITQSSNNRLSGRASIVIGAYATNSSNPFRGTMDEVRISNIGRTDAWIKAEYLTLTNDLIEYPVANPLTYNVTSSTITLSSGLLRTHYDFDGWFANADLVTSPISSIASSSTGDLDLYARWVETNYSISYVLNNGTLTSPINAYTSTSGTVTLPTTITRDIHRFDGWYDNGSFTGEPIVSFDASSGGNKTFYAKWIEDVKYGIKIQHTKIDENLTNFPLTVILNDSNFNFTGIQTSGIYFTDAAGSMLDFEIDFIGTSPNRAVYHVRVPSVSASVDTLIYARVSTEHDFSGGRNPRDVWDANYVFVSHMGQTLVDSTGNVTTPGANNGTSVVTSIAGEARSFDGLNDYILFDQQGPLTQMQNTSITVTAIAFLDDAPGSTFRLIANNGAGWSKQGFYFAVDSTGIRNQMGNGSSETIYYSSLKPTNGIWQLIGIGYNHSTNRQVSYLNTSSANAAPSVSSIYDYRSNADLNIGAGKAADSLDQTATSNTTANRFFKGDIDEFRISNISRSAAWVKAEYLSLTNDLIVFSGQPVINMTGSGIVNHPVNTTYNDAGATAVDGDGGTINNIQVTNNVNTQITGVYTVDYVVTVGDITVTTSRTVFVVDITAPTVSLSGVSPYTIPYSADPYTITDPGLIITDDYDTNLTPVFLNVDGDPVTLESLVDVTTLGSTVVTYTVLDSAGNATTIQRTFVVIDEIAPVVQLIGEDLIVVEVGSSYSEAGITFSDNYSINSAITVTSGVTRNGSASSINPGVVGDYILTYTLVDENSNQSTITRTISVLDTTPPVISNITDQTINASVALNFVIPVASITDNSNLIQTSGTVFTSVSEQSLSNLSAVRDELLAGRNVTIEYTAVDPSGNSTTETIVITAVDDIDPIITGPTNQTVQASNANTFVIPVAAISDNSSIITASGIEYYLTSGNVVLADEAAARQAIFEMNGVTIRYRATDATANETVVAIALTPQDDIIPVFSGLSSISVTGAGVASFALPVPQIIDNDPLTSTYSVRAILGAASVSDLTLLRANQITAIQGLSNCSTSTNTCTNGSNSPGNERFPNAFDQRVNTKYLNFNRLGAGIEFSLDQARSIKRIEFQSANDVPDRDPMTFVLQGLNGSNQWVNVATGNTNLTNSRYTIGAFVSIDNAPTYERYRIFFPTIRNNGANSMQIADIFLYVTDTVFETDLAAIRSAIQSRVPVTLEYTVVDAAGNTTVETRLVNLVNFVPTANANVTLPLTSGTANLPYLFTYPADPIIDTDFDESLTYTTSGLPPGLSFDAALMTISGTPTLVEGASIEDYTITLIATDSQLDSGIRTHVIRVFYTTNITFVSNGGSAVATQTNIIAQPLPAEPIPFLRGYTFEGWFTDSAFITEFDWDGVMPEVDQTLYAKWSPTVYTITYIDAGSIDGLPATYTVESADITLARPSRTGLIFGGWSDNGFIPQSSIGNRTFTASWIPRTYTLTLIADGRQVSRSSIAFGSSLSSVSLGMPPSRVGYDAVGWNQELPATMPAENITITAVYTIRSFNFTALDDEGNEIARSTVNFNAAVPYPSNPEKEGFTFVRWSTSPASMPASDLTVSAVFEVAEFDLTFVDSEGNNLGSATVAFGAAVTAIEPPEKEGFVFVEWTGLPDSMPAAAVTVTAVYEEVVVEEEPEIEETDDEVDDEEDDETTEVAAPVVPTLPNRRPINPIIIPDVILPDNPDPVVTRVSVNGVELDVSIIPGQPVGVLPQPTLPGYNFQGWLNAITGEMITPETVINNPDFVVLVPLFEKAPSLIDAARSVFQALVASSFTVPQTNDFTTRTDNIQSVRGDDANIPAPIPLQRGLQAVFNLNGSVTIPLPKERTPITLRVQGLDALTTEVFYYIGEGAPEFDDPSWRLYTEQPFLSAKQGESVFMMVKDAYDTHQVSYLKPATFVENPERIPTGTVILSLDDDTSLTNTKLNTFLTKIEYEDTMVDLFMFEPTATNDLEQVIVRYRANDHNKSLLISVEAMTWREEIVTLGNSLGVYLRSGDNLTFEVEYQFRGQESVIENFQLTFEGESIGVFLAVSPNSFLRAMLAILILSTLIAPYLVPSTPKQ